MIRVGIGGGGIDVDDDMFDWRLVRGAKWRRVQVGFEGGQVGAESWVGDATPGI